MTKAQYNIQELKKRSEDRFEELFNWFGGTLQFIAEQLGEVHCDGEDHYTHEASDLIITFSPESAGVSVYVKGREFVVRESEKLFRVGRWLELIPDMYVEAVKRKRETESENEAKQCALFRAKVQPFGITEGLATRIANEQAERLRRLEDGEGVDNG